eukprot:TRINITY_DN2928_c0_g1_i1.p1 TRINITY_DN2928_c0_g1~~TRINITY_DN2928_c0_g1_i1.p1  ORF type:complete len:674 (-),score=181.92 TRINITY_DN2928_c0_g1_i1:81-2102(-)
MQDANRDRMVYYLQSLVGQQITVEAHNNVTYEGILDKFTFEGDAQLTLKQVTSSDGKETEEPLVLSSKDFLHVTALDVLPLDQQGDTSSAPSKFKTDGEMAEAQPRIPGRQQDLVEWSDSGEARSGVNLQLEQVAEQKELCTTELDPSTIPEQKRKKADKIAREIETGQSDARFEEGLEGEDDEEPRFSPVAATEGRVPLTQENMSQHDARHMTEQLQNGDDAFAREHRTKRYMITAHSPMRAPMVSEMKRINALNLEPALPKLDDKTRHDWIAFKQARARQELLGSDLRNELQQSLQALQQRDVERQTRPLEEGAHPGSAEPRSGSQQQAEALAGDGTQLSQSSRADEMKPVALDPSAKEFSFNPQAATFTPTGRGEAVNAEGSAKGSRLPSSPKMPAPASQAQASRSPMTGQGPAKPSRPFVVPKLAASKRSLGELLSRFFAGSVVGKVQNDCPQWDTDQRFSCRDALGKLTSGSPQVPGLQLLQQQVQQQMLQQMQHQQRMPQQQMQHQQQPPPMHQSQRQMGMGMPQSPSMSQQTGHQGFGMAMPGSGNNSQQQQPQQQMFQLGNNSQQQQPQQQMFQQQQQQMFQQMPGRGPLPRPSGPQSVQGPHGHIPPQHVNMGAGMNNAVPKFGGQVMPMMVPGGQFPGQGFMPPQGGMQGRGGTPMQHGRAMQ